MCTMMKGRILSMTLLQKLYFHRKGTKNAKKKESPSILNVKRLCVILCVFAVQKIVFSAESSMIWGHNVPGTGTGADPPSY